MMVSLAPPLQVGVEVDGYQTAMEESWVYDELKEVRNSHHHSFLSTLTAAPIPVPSPLAFISRIGLASGCLFLRSE